MQEIDWSSLATPREIPVNQPSLDLGFLIGTNRPAIIRGLAADWSMVAAGRRSPRNLADSLRRFSYEKPIRAFVGPPEIKGRFFYDRDLRGFNFTVEELPISKLLDTLLDQHGRDHPPGIYAGAIPVRENLPGILEENDLGLFGPDQERLISLWVGNRTRTAAHWDLPHNIACVVAGNRRFTLFPPSQLPNMYAGPLDVTPAGQPISLVDLHRPDFERFPRFREALEHAQVAELEPGDALFIPSMWWHHAESLSDFGVLMNYWWRVAEPYMFTPLFSLFHSLLSMRDLPADERVIWKQFFDFYIFQTEGDPMKHLPDHARGVLGPMTPENVQRLRAYLIKGLGGKP